MGKGSGRRPPAITRAEWDANYERLVFPRACETCSFIREPHRRGNRNCCHECETSDGKEHSFGCNNTREFLARSM